MPIPELVAINATLPISRILIPELFSEIIHFALAVTRPRTYSHMLSSATYDGLPHPIVRLGAAVVASHVSYAWRELCTGTPSFWAPYIGFNPIAVGAFLARSVNVPVDVWYEQEGENDCWLSTISLDPQRIRSLECHTLHMSCSNPMSSILSGRLESLEKLSLGFTRNEDWRDFKPDTLDAPKLRYMSLDGGFLSANCHNLQRLALENATIPISKLLDLLRANSCLTFLSVYECDLSTEEINAALEACSIKLPRMNMLHLWDHNRENGGTGFCNLLASLETFPKNITVSAGFGWTKALLQKCLSIAYKDARPSLLWVNDDNFALSTLPPSYVPEVRPVYDWDIARWHIGTVDAYSPRSLGNIFTTLQPEEFHHITTISIRDTQGPGPGVGDSNPPANEIRVMWSAFPSVETFWIELPNMEVDNLVFLDALAPGEASHTFELPTPFPHLQTLGIAMESLDPKLLTKIHEVLMARERTGMPMLKTIALPNTPQPLARVVGDLRPLYNLLKDGIYWKERLEERAAFRAVDFNDYLVMELLY